MIKEVQPLDIFDTAMLSYPPDDIRKSVKLDTFAPWRQLAGSIWGAMRRFRPGEQIWQEISLKFEEALSHKNAKEAQLLIPYVARLVIDLHNLLETEDQIISMDDLLQYRPDSPVNKFLPSDGQDYQGI